MRRTLILFAGLGALTTGLACQHTAGKCDCTPLVPPCQKYGLYSADCCGGAPAAPAVKKEMIPSPATKPNELPAAKE